MIKLENLENKIMDIYPIIILETNPNYININRKRNLIAEFWINLHFFYEKINDYSLNLKINHYFNILEINIININYINSEIRYFINNRNYTDYNKINNTIIRNLKLKELNLL